MINRQIIIDQTIIANGYNQLVESLKHRFPQLTKLDGGESGGGICHGLSSLYSISLEEGSKEEFLTYLEFFTKLNHPDFLEYSVKKLENSTNILYGTGPQICISIEKMSMLVTAMNKAQDENVLLGATWLKTYSFICHQDQLTNALVLAGLQTNDKVFLISPAHTAYFKKSKEGFYLFEPNKIDKYARYTLLKSESDLAKKIIDNYKNDINKNALVVFQFQFASYEKVNFYEMIQKNYRTELLQLKIDHLEKNMKEKKLSIMEYFFVMADRLFEFIQNNKHHPFLNNFRVLKEEIDFYIKDEVERCDKFFGLSLPYLTEHAFMNNFSLFSLIAAENQITLTKKLLAHSVNVDQKFTNLDLPPLYVACQNDLYDLAQLLINSKADINATTLAGCSSLLYAINAEYYSLGKLLINSNADLNYSDTTSVCSALHLAIDKKNHAFVSYLVDHKVNVNLALKNDCTPLTLAVSKHDADMTKLLLVNGATITAPMLNNPSFKFSYLEMVTEELDKLEEVNVSLLMTLIDSPALDLHARFGRGENHTYTLAERILLQSLISQSFDLLKFIISKVHYLDNFQIIEKIIKNTVPDQLQFTARKWFDVNINKYNLSMVQNHLSILGHGQKKGGYRNDDRYDDKQYTFTEQSYKRSRFKCVQQ
jgi:ankyrin repeat protein